MPSAWMIGSVVYDVYRNLLALALCNGTHQNPDLLDDLSLTADDFAHIPVGNADFINRLAAVGGLALGHRNLIRIINKILYYIGE